MSEQENIALVKQAYVAFNEGDIDSLLGMFTDDADWEYPSVDGVPHGGSRKGRGQIGEFFQTLASAEDVLELAQHDFIAQGNKVAVTIFYKTRIKATDRPFESEGVNIWTVGNGKFEKLAVYFDTAGYAEAYRQGARAGA